MLRARATKSPHTAAWWARSAGSGWHALTWQQASDAVAVAAHGLRVLGLRRGDRVGLIASSSPQWDIAQFAVLAAGGVVVGLDPHDTEQRLAQMAQQCGLVGVVVQNEALLGKLGSQRLGALRFAVTLTAPAVGSMVAFGDLGRLAGSDPGANWDLSQPADEALVIFTSGTTGESKGVMYTHRQVCLAVATILQTFSEISPGSRLVCWLPLSNLFQRIINLCALGRGAQVYYIEDPRTVMDHVAEISPHLFIGVPRFYEKLHSGIVEAVDAKPVWQRALAQWAIRAGERRSRAIRAGTRPSVTDRFAAKLADRLVLTRIRSLLGSSIQFLISGSAPMPVWLLERLHGLGFLVLEAYGMSECIVPVAVNTPQRYSFGTVGRPLEGLEVKLASDGELLVRGAGVFSGYLGERGALRRLGFDGFLASGDFARIDEDGFVTLIGRKSDMFKTSTGRRIAPATVEGHLRRIEYVEHAVVVGANRPFLLAVLAVSGPVLANRAAQSTSNSGDLESYAATIRADLHAALVHLPDYQRPVGVVLMRRPFSTAEGHLTPNLKVRRKQVEQTFGPLIDELGHALAHHPGTPVAISKEQGAALLLSA
jgi:long-chain acyl-CoA synthetase